MPPTILKVFKIDPFSFCIGYLDIINMQPRMIWHVIVTDGNRTRALEGMQVEGISRFTIRWINVITPLPPSIVLQYIAIDIERSLPTQRGLRRLRFAP